MTEANSRIIIDKLLREFDWVLSGDDGMVNVDTEMQNQDMRKGCSVRQPNNCISFNWNNQKIEKLTQTNGNR